MVLSTFSSTCIADISNDLFEINESEINKLAFEILEENRPGQYTLNNSVTGLSITQSGSTKEILITLESDEKKTIHVNDIVLEGQPAKETFYEVDVIYVKFTPEGNLINIQTGRSEITKKEVL